MSGHKNAESMKIFQNHRHRGLPKGPQGAFFICRALSAYPERKAMNMIRGTDIVSGREATALRQLESRFRSRLH
ncbi:hypothetical protein CRN81_09785 [Chromobacterium violaceum]|nr:hypothetical protein CRN81_09785 [Chromobacterium violaceum]